MRRASSFLLLLLLLGCTADSVDRVEWERMSRDERVLYVQTLIAEQKAREAKGGEPRTFDAPPEQYVVRIDAAYARGDARDVREIFTGMETQR